MEAPQRVLVVDDDEILRRAIVRTLRVDGREIIEASSGIKGRDAILQHAPQVVLTDLHMPDGDGMFLLRTVQAQKLRPRMIVLTGQGSMETAVEAMQLGAMTVLQKPIDPEVLTRWINRALALPPDTPPNAWAEKTDAITSVELEPRLMIGRSPQMEKVYNMIGRVARGDSTVLVTGESGVGKELVVRELHAASKRASGPFVAVNCAAIPESLLESELFGHKKGAFTHATTDRDGKFKMAEGGTIFLDEIGEMKLELQSKLLRVLQEREYQPVGSNKTIKGDFRVVAATNQSLERLVEVGAFRADLYYRLSVFPISVVPLRERKGDIPDLVQTFVREHNEQRGTQIEGIDPEVMERLVAYPWPGNVRELRNVVECMAVLRHEGTVGLEDLPDRVLGIVSPPPLAPTLSPSVISGVPAPAPVVSAAAPAASASSPSLPVAPPMIHAVPPTAVAAAPSVHPFLKGGTGVLLPEEGLDLNAALRTIEGDLIRQALERTGGNKNRAAKLLRINRTTLVEKLKREDLGLTAYAAQGRPFGTD